ncbi:MULTISPECIES: cupredoxin family copper-binding protein [unclassified Caballeronia]|uniref:cupredoxin domain-containing protein n=1 Tax=unclassified Caballeronia TaxID=2646786 RepID=UPI0028542822|nr:MULTISPECIES: cupredoxin family copper-binding protein [unclassified Caballeronia]MDR5740994.1 cupredoxin family copper-binding protein [Caballeronia sp. LZ016]MDR5806892.1 cupredoxin family copper-binding protein [Caballeronia sp. LZ019]
MRLLILLILLMSALVLPADAIAATHVVVIEGMRFDPPALTVARGDRVVWINKDLLPHTATADAKAFDSHDIAANASWSYVARDAGHYAYSCALHPAMHAVLDVRQ